MTKERTALVTGAASGIGLGIARMLLHSGTPTVLLDRDSAVEGIAELEVKETGTRAWGVVADLADPDAVVGAARIADELTGGVDILVNNAGISPKYEGGPMLVDVTDRASWDMTVAVNLTAPFLLCQALLPGMRERGWGRIVMMSSRAGRSISPVCGVAYSATKTGLLGLARRLAHEVAEEGVTVNSVAPGPVRTPITDTACPEKQAEVRRQVPVGRHGTTDEVAALVAYFVSDAAAFTTGSVVDINGGSYLP